MKLRFLILIMSLAVIAGPGVPQQTQGPLSKNQVMALVKAGMETPELVKLIHEHGIDFDLSDDYLQALRQVEAQDPVIQALRAARPKPLTQEQVLELVAGHVPSQRAATLVKQHGIDFLPDEEYLKTLRLAGAEDTLIAALREASAAATAQLVVETSPNAEVYLDSELQGHADAQGELTMKAKLGAHTLKVTLAGKKDFEQSVTLASVQATRVEAQLAELLVAGTVRENLKDRLKYVWIPAGTFVMGCSPGDNECRADEKPSHHVTISKGFWIGQMEVTVGAYKRFAAATGRQRPPAPNFDGGWVNDSMPIVNVTWDDAHEYCAWAGGRLPSEAEWEYAARGGSTEARYGSIDEVAWYGANSGAQTHSVGEKRANGFGLYDMLGNVAERVNDWYDQGYSQNRPSQDPIGPTSGSLRVLRGGSWGVNLPGFVRVSGRDRSSPGVRDNGVGVRCGGEVFAP
jgi:formylglycine-generating enzyme required for sulfatase activity